MDISQVQGKLHFPKLGSLEKNSLPQELVKLDSFYQRESCPVSLGEGTNGYLGWLLAYRSACWSPGSAVSQGPVTRERNYS